MRKITKTNKIVQTSKTHPKKLIRVPLLRGVPSIPPETHPLVNSTNVFDGFKSILDSKSSSLASLLSLVSSCLQFCWHGSTWQWPTSSPSPVILHFRPTFGLLPSNSYSMSFAPIFYNCCFNTMALLPIIEYPAKSWLTIFVT